MHSFISLIFYMFSRAVLPALVGAALGTAVLILLRAKRRREGAAFSLPQGAAILLLFCYLGGLAAITLALRSDSFRIEVQTHFLLAFWEAWNAFTLQAWLNPLLNIAMFFPLGVLLPLAAKPFRRWYWMLAAGVGASLLIEILQYILGRGQADVDDLFCNTLGAMLGYCLCMIVVSLAKKQWKPAGAYAVLPLLSAAVLAGVFLVYQLQPYGNLADAPIFPAHTSGTQWVLECELSGEPGPSGVYWAEPFTKESCDEFALAFAQRRGVDTESHGDYHFDIEYYDNTTFYSNHTTFALIVDHNDCSYRYTDYQVDSNLRFSDTGGIITEGELRTALEKLGIDVPDAAQFTAIDEERGKYAFRADCVVDGDVLTAGELTCRVAEGGVLYEVDNALSVSTLHGDAAVISEQEAYDRLCTGRFNHMDAAAFEYFSFEQIRVTACALEYIADSKGFRQPVYFFSLATENTAPEWRVFVPALAG